MMPLLVTLKLLEYRLSLAAIGVLLARDDPAREEAGFSLREVGRRLGKNHTTIVHIETGRMDVPKGERLMDLLRLYGLDNLRAFYDRVRNLRERPTARQELKELADRLSDDRLEIVLRVAKRIAEGKAVIAL